MLNVFYHWFLVLVDILTWLLGYYMQFFACYESSRKVTILC